MAGRTPRMSSPGGIERRGSAFDPMTPKEMKAAFALLYVLGLACARPAASSSADANVGIDSLNAHIVRAYRDRDPQLYASLYTDSAVFEWPAIDNVRGRAGMA